MALPRWLSRTLRAHGRAATFLGRALGILVGLVLLAAAVALFLVTQTSFGRNAVASFVQETLDKSFNGSVTVGPVLGGNLLTRATLARFEIVGPDGEPFVSLEDVRVSYSPFGILTGNYTFRRLSAGRLDLNLHQYPGGEWNFERIFGPADTATGAPPDRTRLVVADADLRGGSLEMRTPWAENLTGEAYEQAVNSALRGEALWIVEPDDGGGYSQVIRLTDLRGRFPLIRLVDPTRPFRVDFERVQTVLDAVAEPLDLRRFDGSMVFSDTVRMEIRDARLPASRLEGRGWIAAESEPAFRFELDGNPIGFSDVQWLPFPVPADGGGPADLVIRADSGVTVIAVRDAEIEVDDSRMVGGLKLAIEDGAETPHFDSVSMRLQPLRLRLLDELLERPTLIDGYLSGSIDGSGPTEEIQLQADLQLRDLSGGSAPSGLSAVGGVGLIEPSPMNNLVLRLDEFEPRWAAVAGFANELEGRVNGEATLNGVPDQHLTFDGDLEHTTPGGAVSRLTGSAAMEPPTSPLQMNIDLQPLQLAALAPYLPESDLVGAVRGPIDVSGTLADLRVDADLETPRGSLEFDGSFDLEAERKRYDSELTASEIQLNEWIAGGPDTRLAVHGRVTGEGTDPADLRATFDLEILPSTFEGVRVDSSLLRFTLANGIATADTFALRSEAGSIDGSGAFGLTEDTTGDLQLDIRADLGSWNRWLEGADTTGTPALASESSSSSVERLLDDFGGSESESESTASPTTRDTLSGTLVASGRLSGNAEAFGVSGQLDVRRFAFGSFAADSMVGALDVADAFTRDTLSVSVTAWDLEGGFIGEEALDSVHVAVDREGGPWTALDVFARRDTSARITLVSQVELTPEERRMRLDSMSVNLGGHELTLLAPSLLAYGDSGFVVQDFAVNGLGGATIRADGSIPREGSANLSLAFDSLHVEHLLEMTPIGMDLGGVANGEVTVRGTAAAPVIDGRLDIASPRLLSAELEDFTATLSYEDQEASLDLALTGEGSTALRASGTVKADLSFTEVEQRLPEDAVDLDITAVDVPFALIGLVSDDFTDITGTLNGDVRLRGRPGEFQYEGEAALVDGSAWLVPLEIRYTDIGGRVSFDGSDARIDSLTLSSALGGSVVANGTVGVGSALDPTLDLDLQADAFHALDQREMSFVIAGTGKLGGSLRTPDLTGTFRISNGDVRIGELIRGPNVVDLTSPDIASLIDTTNVEERELIERQRNALLYNLRVDVDVQVGPAAWIRAPEMDVELTGEVDVRMHRAEQDIRITGELQSVRGSYRFILKDIPGSREFKLTEGRIDFTGSPTPDPNLDIRAVHTTRTDRGELEIEAHLTGRVSDMQITLTSDPPLSESDQICYLTFGGPCAFFSGGNEPGATTSVGRQLAQQTALGLVGSQLSSFFVGDLGVDFFNIKTSESRYDNYSDNFFAGAAVEIGSYLGRDVYFTLSQPLDGRQPDLALDWYFARDWTLEARFENRYQRLFAAGSNLDTRQTFGVFLFREWSY